MADNSKFVPPKGMRDWLPQETLLRQKLIRLIESHYQLYGFQPIDTPVMENIEVLQGKGGGENEKLMFKVMKRGEDLDREIESLSTEEKIEIWLKFLNSSSFDDDGDSKHKWIKPAVLKAAVRKMKEEFSKLSSFDMGLRFDMTVPLARYYGNHASELPKPFRCYHIGPVWRADRPQKGRFREFYQCDIDIVGSTSENCEVELLLATDRVLKELKIGKFIIRISDRRFIKSILDLVNVNPKVYEKIFSHLDKLGEAFFVNEPQTGGEYVEPELWDEYIRCREKIREVIQSTPGELETNHPEIFAIYKSIKSIERKVKEVQPDVNVKFDHCLVRGLDYYTGSVFEVRMVDENYRFSIAGGGRYDGLIEKLGGPKNTPAVGLSLGFERILTILMEKEGGVSKTLQQRVYIVNDGKSEKDIQVLAETLRSNGIAVETGLEKKDKVKQLVAAQGNGLEYAITDFVPGAATFKVRQLSNRQDTEMNAEQLKEVLSKLL